MIKEVIKIFDKKIFFGLLKKIYLFFLRINATYGLYKNNKYDYKNISYYNNNRNILSKLCEKHGSDKGYINFKPKTIWGWKSHTYSNYYHSLFNHCKDQIKLVFECGIGTNNPNLKSNMTSKGKPGASLRVWRDYFTNAIIYGADIDKKILFNENRIKTHFVDQLDKDTIKIMWSNFQQKNFDIIIDDGLHTEEANINLFVNSFYKLRKNGIYIIEDIHFSYLHNIERELKKFNPETILLGSKKSNYQDNNLMVFRKN
jgi:hypothetical protein